MVFFPYFSGQQSVVHKKLEQNHNYEEFGFFWYWLAINLPLFLLQKKLPEFLLAQTKKECSRNVSEFYNSSSFGYGPSFLWSPSLLKAVPCSRTMLNCSADLDELLAKEQVQYEILVEEHVLKPLVDLDVSKHNQFFSAISYFQRNMFFGQKEVFSSIENKNFLFHSNCLVTNTAVFNVLF